MSRQQSKYARPGRASRILKGTGQKGDKFYARISGQVKPVVGDSLIALEAKLKAIQDS